MVLTVTFRESSSPDLEYVREYDQDHSEKQIPARWPPVPPAPDSAAGQLAALATAISSHDYPFVPPLPQSIEQTGISEGFIDDLILKTLYARGETIGRDLAGALGLKFSLIEPRVEFLKSQRLILVKGSLGFGSVSAAFAMSEGGRTRVRECLEQNQYVGPSPVPIDQYVTAVRNQRLKSGWLTLETLKHAYRGMIVSADVLGQIGPAVNSGKSLLIYGQPGNGKTFLAEALCSVNESPIYVPYAIEYHGNIIKVFDPIHHTRMEEREDLASSVTSEARYDSRWARCRRPFIITGGELSISMLDLGYNSISKVYDAPFHLKANNGIYLIDDFGRQKSSPAELLNRWIVPMDRRVDYLSFHTGGKIEVPFEAFVIFSTNLQPEQLGDEAFLRRIHYKLLMRSPVQQEFVEIFGAYCASQHLQCSEALVGQFIEKHYTRSGKRFRRCHPRDVISHAIDLIAFEQLPLELTDGLLDRAFESCFVASETDD
jgi:predicted ATPase with chaperone activity